MAQTSSRGVPRRSLKRRLERWVLGIGMSVVAFFLERRVLRTIKRRGEAPPSREASERAAERGVTAEGPVFDISEP
jgi:hypothetical protein